MKVLYNTLEQDPIGSFRLEVEHMESIGRMPARLHLPLPVIQEGGYPVPSPGACAPASCDGLGLDG